MKPERYFGDAVVIGGAGLLLLGVAALVGDPFFVTPGAIALACGAFLAGMELR